MAWDFSNGLLGWGGLGGGQQNIPANSLLGEFYNPADMRKYQMKQMLLGLGAGLLSEKGLGRGATMALAAGDLAGRSYRENAMDAYKMKQQADQQTYERGKDAKDEAYRQKLLAIQIAQEGRAAEAAQHQRDQWEADAELKRGKTNAVVNFNRGIQLQGGDLFSPQMQGWLRNQGVSGVDPTESQRYQNMQPYVKAGDFDNAFTQMTAQPDTKAPDIKEIYDANGQPVKVQWKNGQWVPVGGSKAQTGGPSMSMTMPDGTRVEMGNNASLPGEMGSRLGLGQQFLDTDLPEIMPMIKNGDATGPIDYAKGIFGRGNSGIVQRRMASGVDALRRNLTGAGMSASEAGDYANRYLPQPTDDAETLQRKAESLAADLTAVRNGAIAGKSGALGSFLPGSKMFAPSASQGASANTSGPIDPANPRPGDVVLGYRFKGGDRRDRNNWEKVGQ